MKRHCNDEWATTKNYYLFVFWLCHFVSHWTINGNYFKCGKSKKQKIIIIKIMDLVALLLCLLSFSIISLLSCVSVPCVSTFAVFSTIYFSLNVWGSWKYVLCIVSANTNTKWIFQNHSNIHVNAAHISNGDDHTYVNWNAISCACKCWRIWKCIDICSLTYLLFMAFHSWGDENVFRKSLIMQIFQ